MLLSLLFWCKVTAVLLCGQIMRAEKSFYAALIDIGHESAVFLHYYDNGWCIIEA